MLELQTPLGHKICPDPQNPMIPGVGQFKYLQDPSPHLPIPLGQFYKGLHSSEFITHLPSAQGIPGIVPFSTEIIN